MRYLVAVLLAAPLLLLALSTSSAAESPAGSRPNIILMMTDDQGYGPVGRHGHPWINTSIGIPQWQPSSD